MWRKNRYYGERRENKGKKENRRVKMREKKNQEGGTTTERGIGKQKGNDTNKGGKVRKRLGRILERKEKKITGRGSEERKR